MIALIDNVDVIIKILQIENTARHPAELA